MYLGGVDLRILHIGWRWPLHTRRAGGDLARLATADLRGWRWPLHTRRAGWIRGATSSLHRRPTGGQKAMRRRRGGGGGGRGGRTSDGVVGEVGEMEWWEGDAADGGLVL
jgi:hypothetical protein